MDASGARTHPLRCYAIRVLSSDPWRHVTFIVFVLRIYNKIPAQNHLRGAYTVFQ